jgi:hypothetical protein
VGLTAGFGAVIVLVGRAASCPAACYSLFPWGQTSCNATYRGIELDRATVSADRSSTPLTCAITGW